MRTFTGILRSAAALALLQAAVMTLQQAPLAQSTLSPAGEGRRLYLKENCYVCHGGRGGGGMDMALRGEADSVGGVLQEGVDKGMPAYPNLTTQDAQNLSAYLRSLRTPSEPTFTHWWEAVPSR
jgi:mono/diheme cytochrome c family protein